MATDEHFRRHKFRPDIRLELGSNEAIKQSVAGGLGLAVVSAHALGEEAGTGRRRAARRHGIPDPVELAYRASGRRAALADCRIPQVAP